jgi:hypothetical protein
MRLIDLVGLLLATHPHPHAMTLRGCDHGKRRTKASPSDDA